MRHTVKTAAAGSRSVLGGSVAQLGGRAIGMSLGLVGSMLLARYLGISRYGELASVLAFWAMLSLVSEMGVSSVVGAEIARPGEDVATVWSAGVLVQLAYSGLAVLIGAVAVRLFLGAVGGGMALVYGMLIGFASLPAVNAIHQVRMRMWIPSLLGVVQSFVALALVVAGIVTCQPWQYFVLATAVAGIVAVALNIAVGVKERGVPVTPLLPTLKRVARMSVPIGLAGILATAYYRIDTILVFRLAGSAAAGAYGAAYRLYEVGLMVPTAVMATALPVAVSRLHKGPTEFKTYTSSMLAFLVSVAGPYMLAVTLLAPLLVGLIFGRQFTPALPVLVLLMPATVARFGSIWCGTMLIASGGRRRYFVATAAIALTAVALYFVLIPQLGATGAAAATAGIEWVALILMIFAMPAGLRVADLARLAWFLFRAAACWAGPAAAAYFDPSLVWKGLLLAVSLLIAVDLVRDSVLLARQLGLWRAHDE